MSTSKDDRSVGEMAQIANTQGRAGVSAELFAGLAAVYRRLAATEVASMSPEDAAALTGLEAVLRRLR